MNEKLTLKELTKLYNVSERTLYNWRVSKSLPIVEITPHNKFVYKSDLIEWENSFR